MARNTKKNKALQGESSSIDCGDLLDISMVNDIHQKLKKSLDSGSDIAVNVSQIQRVDAAGVQMLCAFFQDAKSRNIKCTWENPSEVFLTSVQQLGLTTHLGIAVSSQEIMI